MSESESRAAHVADITFTAGDLDPGVLRVNRLRGTEGISELFRFRVDLCSQRDDVRSADVLGQACVIEMGGPSGARFVNGIVRRFACLGSTSRLTHYAAEVVPVHWRLTRRFRSRIFQDSNCSDMTVAGIVTKVLEDAGVPAGAYRLALEREDYPQHEYVVQYRESEFAFISRLMEAEGIFYFFEHSAGGHTLVIADSPAAHADTPNAADFPFRPLTGLVPEGDRDYVYRVSDRTQFQVDRVGLDDFDFTRPPYDLWAESHAESDDGSMLVDYPGAYTEREVGQQLARLRLEEFQCRKRVLGMSTTARGLLPGFRFTLTEHPQEGLNGRYVVTHIEHSAAQPQSAEEETLAAGPVKYSLRLRAIPADVPFRPPPVTPHPTVHGSQTALVVGPAGEEIYTDRYGRVKVEFHWDREGHHDEHSSCWIRVSQGLAGGQYGIMFLPRVGQEVVVDFLEGDPDQPLIAGRVYNNDQMPPYTLPDEKTKSCLKTNSSQGGGGTNEPRFEDLKDNEQVLLYAQGTLHVRANGERRENIGGQRHLTVNKDKCELVKENKHCEVQLDLNEKIGGNKSLRVSGDVGEEFAGNHSEKTAGNLFLKADREIVIEAGTALTLKVSGNFVKIDAAGVSIFGQKTLINSSGCAGVGSPVALSEPALAQAADSATPGHDTTYSQESEDGAADEDERDSSWVEIEMVDEAGAPWPNEPYEITLPDGNVRQGQLDSSGRARVLLPTATDVQVSFPQLDGRAWEKIQ